MTSESNEKLRTARFAYYRQRSKYILLAAVCVVACVVVAVVAGHDSQDDDSLATVGWENAEVGQSGAGSKTIGVERDFPGDGAPEENTDATIRFYDIVESLPPAIPRDVHPVSTAYEESTVVQRAPWFRPPPTVECNAACCSSAVAISLGQDELRPINTLDGDDIADVRLRAFQQLKPTERYVMRGFRKAVVNLTHHAVDLTPELAPCLKAGTVIHIDMFPQLLLKFFKEIRPKMTKSYVLITTGTDNPSPPDDDYLKVLNKDNLLIRWYGTNANPSALGHPKFVPMPLGLARDFVAQQVELAALQKARGGGNPFAGSAAKARWMDAPELFANDVHDTSQSLFVNFGMSKSKKTTHRAGPFRMACDGRTGGSSRKEAVSCVNGTFPLRTLYSAASQYLFALSPPGRGTDCYRTYELLLLGVIPIVWHHPMYSALPGALLEGLPHIELNGLNYTQEDLVTIMREYVKGDFAKQDFGGWERMFMKYWRRRVLEDAGRTSSIMIDDYGKEYYRAFVYSQNKGSSILQ